MYKLSEFQAFGRLRQTSYKPLGITPDVLSDESETAPRNTQEKHSSAQENI